VQPTFQQFDYYKQVVEMTLTNAKVKITHNLGKNQVKFEWSFIVLCYSDYKEEQIKIPEQAGTVRLQDEYVDNPQQRVHSLLLFQFCALHD
jgi:hypothetical protein